MGLKVFITGAGGYLGGVIASYLSKMTEIDCITAMVHNKPFRMPVPAKVDVIKMDICSPELADAVAGNDYVIHAAHLVYWPWKMSSTVRDDINFNGTRNIAQAALKNQVRGFLHASSIAAYDPVYVQGKENIGEDAPLGSGVSPLYYWNSKADTEKILNEVLGPSKTVLTLFRIGYVIGPCDDATVPFFRKNAMRNPFQNPRMNFVHEDDVAQAFALAMRTHMPGAFNVISDRTIRLSELYETIGAKPITVPAWLACLVSYMRWRFFGSLIHPSWVRSTLIDCVFNNAKLKATGWMPHYNGIEAVRTAV